MYKGADWALVSYLLFGAMCVVLIVVFSPGCDSTDDFAMETFLSHQKHQILC